MIRIASFLTGICTALALVYFSPFLLKDNPAIGSYWIAKLLTYQDQLLAEKTSKPRLIVIGGSNGLYGFDGNYLEKYSNYQVVNLAIHLGFDLSFTERRLRGHLRQGDVVIATIEHPTYRRDSTTSFQQEQNLLWLERFFHYDTPVERLRENLQTPTEIYARLAWDKLTGQPRNLTGLAELGNDGIKTPDVMTESLPPACLARRQSWLLHPAASRQCRREEGIQSQGQSLQQTAGISGWRYLCHGQSAAVEGNGRSAGCITLHHLAGNG